MKNEKIQDAQREVHTLIGLSAGIEAAYLTEKLKNLQSTLQNKSLNKELIYEDIKDIDKELQKIIVSIEQNLTLQEDKEYIKPQNFEQIEQEIKKLEYLFENFDSASIDSAQNLSKMLRKSAFEDDAEIMLKAALNFDFEEANIYLKKISQKLNTKQ